jgi:hypothetical protein
VRRDGKFGLELVFFVDVIFETDEDLGRNVGDDEFQERHGEGSSHMGEDWRRMSLTMRSGSTGRRVDTWLS